MNIENQTREIISNLGIEALNEMQTVACDIIASQQNTILLSPTGSGKTVAFLLSVLQALDKDIKTVQCLIILSLIHI